MQPPSSPQLSIVAPTPSTSPSSSLNSQPSNPTLRLIAPADWPSVDQIQRAAFPASAIEGAAVFASFAALSPLTCLLATADNQPIGYLLAHPWTPDDLPPLNTALDHLPENAVSLFIHDLALLPEGRGLGTGRSLVETALAAGKKLGLRSASLLSVQKSQSFWERLGFLPRPELTPRLEPIVHRFTKIDFLFMSRPSLEEVES